MLSSTGDYNGHSTENYGYNYGSGRGGGAGVPNTSHFNVSRGNLLGQTSPYNLGGGSLVASPLDAEINVVCREIQNEIRVLEQSGDYGGQFKNARRLLTTEANKLENAIDPEWLEVDINKPIKITKKILIPSFRHPKFNFVGKVLGPKGTTLQNIAKNYKCHVYVLGRGSTRDRAQEQELLQSGDPQFSHYGGPLHVKVETVAAPAIAYKRVAGVLEVLSQLLVPVKETTIEGITTVNEAEADNENGGGNVENEEKKPQSAPKSSVGRESVNDYSRRGGGARATSGRDSGGGQSRAAGRGGGHRGRGVPRGAPRGRGESRPGFHPY